MQHSVCGLDEAGRGALAGPIVAAGVILNTTGTDIASTCGVPLRDSKTLSKRQRNIVYDALVKTQSIIVTTHIPTQVINASGIGWANKEIFRVLIRDIIADEYIVDGNLNIGPIPGVSGTIRSLVDADATIDAVICAGIVAKVTRDRIMETLHTYYPQFGWDHNAGYGTREHVTMIRSYGMTSEHRTVFVQSAIEKYR